MHGAGPGVSLESNRESLPHALGPVRHEVALGERQREPANQVRPLRSVEVESQAEKRQPERLSRGSAHRFRHGAVEAIRRAGSPRQAAIDGLEQAQVAQPAELSRRR